MARQSLGGVRRFEDLWIWQMARDLALDVYHDFAKSPASVRDFGFRNQIQRASVSTMNNIAEGFERHSDAEFARFLDIAKGSCGEVRSMYYLADELGYVKSCTAKDRQRSARLIAAGIASLAAHLRKSP